MPHVNTQKQPDLPGRYSSGITPVLLVAPSLVLLTMLWYSVFCSFKNLKGCLASGVWVTRRVIHHKARQGLGCV
jgi:hypothetical protein